MNRQEQLAFASKILEFLRALNRPPKKIRTSKGFTTTHEIIRARAKIDLGVEFKDLPTGGVRWATYDEELKRVGEKLLGVCANCGLPFIKYRPANRCCSKTCGHKLWVRSNPERTRSYSRTYARENPERNSRWARENPDQRRAVARKYAAKQSSADRRRKWRAANPARAATIQRRASRRYYSKHAEKIRGDRQTPQARERNAERQRARRADPGVRAREAAIKRTARAKKKG